MVSVSPGSMPAVAGEAIATVHTADARIDLCLVVAMEGAFGLDRGQKVHRDRTAKERSHHGSVIGGWFGNWFGNWFGELVWELVWKLVWKLV